MIFGRRVYLADGGRLAGQIAICLIRYSAGLGVVHYVIHLILRELLTTLTLLSAMAAPAIIGLSRKPLIG